MAVVTTPVAFIKAEFTGRDGAGPVSVPGLKVGDAVLMVTINGIDSNFPRSYEAFVTVDDEIYQWFNGNHENVEHVMLLLRGV